MLEFYMIGLICPKIFSHFFWGGGTSPLPPDSYAYGCGVATNEQTDKPSEDHGVNGARECCMGWMEGMGSHDPRGPAWS